MNDERVTAPEGLTDEGAELSRQRYGSNIITRKRKKGFLKQYMASFGDPIIKILMIALAVNIIFMFRDRDFNWYESGGVAFAVLLATLVSTLSEYGSEAAFEKLQQEAGNVKCRVRRSGKTIELPADDIVVGDVVFIHAGERIPADGSLAAGELMIDQSALNGETREAHKYPCEDGGEIDFWTPNKLFRGSVVCSGEGIMRVEMVGDNSFYGNLATEIQEETLESPLKTRLANLAKTISIFGYIAAAVVVIANLFNNIVFNNKFDPALISAYLSNRALLMRDLTRAVTLGVTVIVMAVPEGLPMMITVVLSANMRRMLKDNVLVRKLVGIETSGSLNILFTDKTGTLTKGKLEASVFLDANGKISDVRKMDRKSRIFHNVTLNCLYNNGAQIIEKDGIRTAAGGNSTDRALLDFIMNEAQSVPLYRKIYTRPFDSKSKLSVTGIIGDTRLFLIKGAPEKLLSGCVRALDANGAEVSPDIHLLEKRISELAREATRVLALCTCESLHDAEELKNLTLTGLIGLRDEIRGEARVAIEEITGAGVQIVMVTGDNLETAVSVAEKAGLTGRGGFERVLTSAGLNAMSDAEIKKILPEIRIIARALPSDKSRLVRLAQEAGLVAGMTGDGVNDAPALKKADVGFAMGDGTEIAKEAGDIVILDDNISSIAKAILYGRTIFKSIRKFLIFQLTINLCAVGVSVIGPFIGVESPVTVIQMLWINMIMDTLAGLAYAGEAPLPEYMREAPKKRGDKIINRYMYSQIICTGMYTTFMCLLFFKLRIIQSVFRGEEKYIMTAFFALFVFAGVFNSLSARTYRLNLFSHILNNKAFILIMGAVLVIQTAMIYYGGAVFRTAGLTLKELVLIVALASSVVLFDIGRKLFLRANKRKGFI